MRITGGQWGGRRLQVPRTDIRPTQDRVRQAVFSSLASLVPGARVLDLFAGTGAYGLEALSRGATTACWIERDPRVCAVLRANVSALAGPDQAVAGCLRGDALRLLPGLPGPFDLIFADPPYAEEWCEQTLAALAAAGSLAPDGVVVYEGARDKLARPPPGWRLIRQKRYGRTCLSCYQAEA
ncbi:MAG: 16S rRNA (guanine(966)-N(2))-methyltransferase RsmD [Candidatus Marinimicrobia bacterium]|nr:16S rRNA (guanine(966)-N(2))-methyltransferase RsmD [Candidatus Neomarinimicrobiota bacterium]